VGDPPRSQDSMHHHIQQLQADERGRRTPLRRGALDLADSFRWEPPR
jgi:hypothetical protein